MIDRLRLSYCKHYGSNKHDC